MPSAHARARPFCSCCVVRVVGAMTWYAEHARSSVTTASTWSARWHPLRARAAAGTGVRATRGRCSEAAPRSSSAFQTWRRYIGNKIRASLYLTGSGHVAYVQHGVSARIAPSRRSCPAQRRIVAARRVATALRRPPRARAPPRRPRRQQGRRCHQRRRRWRRRWHAAPRQPSRRRDRGLDRYQPCRHGRRRRGCRRPRA